jgi:ATP-dependent DNA ligase
LASTFARVSGLSFLADRGEYRQASEATTQVSRSVIYLSLVLNEHFEEDGAIVFREACRLDCEGVVSKRLGTSYRSGRSPHWVKVKSPKAPAVKREADEDWAR